MLLHTKNPQTITDAEDGYILLAVLILVFFLLLSLSIAAPRVAKEIQRDKEQEAVERGLQYQRAIKLYYKKFGSYPTDVKQLEKTNDIRFLRRRYTDPISGKDDWRIIHVGEAKVPPLGFFGEPLQGGLSSQSTGPGLNGPGSGGTATGAGSGSTFGFNNSGSGSPGVGSGSSGAGGSAPAGGFGNFGSSGQSGSGFGGAGFGNANGQPGQPGQGGFANGQPGQPGNGQPGQGGFANGPAGQSNSTFGGSAPIVGVGIPLDKNSQRVYHKQKKYSQWEFVYDPQQDLLAGVGGGQNPAGIQQTGVATPGNANASPNGGSGGFGFQNGPVSGGPGSSPGGGSGFGFGNGSGSGNGSGFGSSNPTPPPANPPQ